MGKLSFKDLAKKAIKDEGQVLKKVVKALDEEIKDLEPEIKISHAADTAIHALHDLPGPTPREILNLKVDWKAGIEDAMACYKLLTGKSIRKFKGKSTKEALLEAVIFAAIRQRDIEKLRKLNIKKK